jgi:hypothetical protein
MEDTITSMIRNMAQSHGFLADILEHKRHVVTHASSLLAAVPHPGHSEEEGVAHRSLLITKSVVAYLNTLAELEFAIADNLGMVMKELREGE